MAGLVGLGVLVLVAASLWLPGPFIAFGQRVVNGSDLAQNAFTDGLFVRKIRLSHD